MPVRTGRSTAGRRRGALALGLGLGLGLVSVLSAVSGCSALDGAPSAPLGGAGKSELGGTQVCMPAATGATLTVGGDELHNSGTRNVVIDKVGLLDPTGLRFVDAVIVPTREGLIGFARRYPPSKFNRDSAGSGWAHRQPAVGATLPPQGPEDTGDDQASAAAASPNAAATTAVATTGPAPSATPTPVPIVHNLVVAVKVTGSSHVGMTGVVVDYHAGSVEYRWHSYTSIRVPTKGKC